MSVAKASAGIGGGRDDDATRVCMQNCKNRMCVFCGLGVSFFEFLSVVQRAVH